jgi:hypothetical protein
VETGAISRPQELTGEEAPSRARKLVSAYDIIISTCRPTRGAIAVVPESLHGQICSTGFSVIRAKEGVNPYYLHFALRLPSTLEQFRKWSTGSSYPAILDSDVEKTKIPLPDIETQDRIAKEVRTALLERERTIRKANKLWDMTINGIVQELSIKTENKTETVVEEIVEETVEELIYSTEQIKKRLEMLPPVGDVDTSDDEDYSELSLFDDEDDEQDIK